MSPASSDPVRGTGRDPRTADVAAIRALLDEVAAGDAETVRLPAMTAAELCVLGGMSSTLIDAAAWSWWISATVPRRPDLRAAAGRFLAHRQLISAGTPACDGGGQTATVRVAPAAAVIVAARTRPAFAVLCRAGGDREPERTRMYGIADTRCGLRAVLIEKAGTRHVGWAGPAYEYQLARPGAAARTLARWALEPAPAQAWTDPSRLIDVHIPGTRDIRPAHRITVRTRAGKPYLLTEPDRRFVTNPLPCDEDVLTRLLTDTLTGACP